MVPKKPSSKYAPETKGEGSASSVEGVLFIYDPQTGICFVVAAETKADDASVWDKHFIADTKQQALKKIGKSYARVLSRIAEKTFLLDKAGEIVHAPSIVEQPLIDEMIAKATEVIGNRGEAMRWLGTPVRALNFATPISVLGTEEGVERVNDVLGQMEYGIW